MSCMETELGSAASSILGGILTFEGNSHTELVTGESETSTDTAGENQIGWKLERVPEAT